MLDLEYSNCRSIAGLHYSARLYTTTVLDYENCHISPNVENTVDYHMDGKPPWDRRSSLSCVN